MQAGFCRGRVYCSRMSYSYVAYIDESGDPGCTGPFRTKSTEGGQSNFLTLATYIVRAEHDGDLIQIRDDIRNEVKPRTKKRHLHFQNLKHEQKLRYCQLLAQQRAWLVAVIFNKAHLDKRAAFSKNSKQLYWYACRLLVERIVRRQHLWDRYSAGLRESFCSS